MANDKNILRYKLPKEKLGRNRRTKKGHKRDTRERFLIMSGVRERNA